MLPHEIILLGRHTHMKVKYHSEKFKRRQGVPIALTGNANSGNTLSLCPHFSVSMFQVAALCPRHVSNARSLTGTDDGGESVIKHIVHLNGEAQSWNTQKKTVVTNQI